MRIRNKSYKSNGNTSFFKSRTCIEMHDILRLGLSILILSFFSNIAFATDYYVAIDGDDSKNGLSIENAWATPSYAATKVTPGDTIYLINGTWENETIDFLGICGNVTNPITLTKYNGTVLLNNSIIKAIGTLTHTSFINISNISLTGYHDGGIFFRLADNIHISNVEIYNTSGTAFSFLDCTQSSLTNSHIHDTGWNSVMVQSNYHDVYGILIENNTIHDSSFNGTNHNTLDFFNYESIASMHDVTVIDNTIYNSAQSLLYFHTGSTGTNFSDFNISNNIFHDSGSGGYVFLNYVTNSTFENNTVYNSGVKIDSNTAFDNVVYRNNTIYSPNAGDQQFTLILRGWTNVTHTSINDNSTSYRTLGGEFIVQDSTTTSYTVRGTEYGITVKYNDNKVFSETGTGEPKYFSTHSNWTTNDDATRTITTYPMTARPASDPATVTVNKFDTSLPQGNTLISFTADTTDGNNVVFTVNDLQPDHYYLVKNDGTDFTSLQANFSGCIQFSNSEWSEHTFTIEETSSLDSGDTGEEPSITEFFPADTSPVQNNGSSYEFNVTVNQPLTSSSWYLDGSCIASETLSLDHTWTHASTHNITFTGSNDNGSVSNIWIVNVTDVPQSTVTITPSTQLIIPGETFTVDVTVSPGEPITGAQFNLNFDSSLLTVNSVTEGDLFSQDGASTLFSSGTINNIAGTVTNVYGSILGGTNVSSEGVLATITLTAGGTGGVSALDISNAMISDVNSNSVLCTITNSTARINSPPSIASLAPAQGAVFDETDVISIDVTASDADEQSLSYTIKVDGVTQGTGSSYSWITDYTSAGSHTIEVIVSDGISETTVQRTITVNNVHPRWDVNEDGTVDVLDLTTIGQQYGTVVEEPYPRWDVNQDGVVNILDMTITSSHFGETGVE